MVGKHFCLAERSLIKLDATIYTLLNDYADLFMADLRLQDTSETFIPSSWVLPRRLMIRIGSEF